MQDPFPTNESEEKEKSVERWVGGRTYPAYLLVHFHAQGRPHILQIRIALNEVHIVLYHLDEVFPVVVFFDVLLVVDLAKHFFLDVFESNHASRAAVFIHHNSHMNPPLSHLLETGPDGHGLGHEVGGLHDGFHWEVEDVALILYVYG